MDSATNAHRQQHHHHHQLQDQPPIGSSSSPSSQSNCYGGSSINHSWTTPTLTNSSNDEFCEDFNGIISHSRGAKIDDHHQNKDDEMSGLSEKLLLKTISSGFSMFPATVSDFSGLNRRSFTQIYPSVNVSSLSSPGTTTNPSSFGMNLQPLDLLSSGRCSGGSFVRQHEHETGELAAAGVFKESHSSGFDLHQLQLRNQLKPPNYPISDICWSSSSMRKEREMTEAGNKKPRLDSRSSCPPFKVRKEKLGDRIAALQQLVAPFGKTDTASVLMEATGYIKFLQNQVETLSVPYMKLSSRRNRHDGISKGGFKMDESNEGSNRDLRSRGLCLVPVSCLSYITNDGGGGIWPPPGYGGAS